MHTYLCISLVLTVCCTSNCIQGELDGSVMAAEAAAQSALNATDGQINATLDRIPVLVMNVTDSLPTVSG